MDQEAVAVASGQLARLQLQISNLKVELHDLQHQDRTQRAALATAVAELQKQREGLQGQVKRAHEELAAAQQEHDRLRPESLKAKALLAHVTKAQAEKKELDGLLAQARAVIADLQGQQDDLYRRVALAKETLGTHDASVEAALRHLAVVREQVDQAVDQSLAAKKEAEAHAAQVVADREAFEKEAQAAARDRALRHEEVRRLAEIATENLTKIEARERALAAREKEAASIKADRKAAMAEIAAAAEQVAKARTLVEEASQRAESAQQTAAAHEADLTPRLKAVAAQEHALDVRAAELEAWAEKLGRHETQLAARESTMQEASLGMAKAEAEVKRAIHERGLEALKIVVPSVPGLPPEPKKKPKKGA